MAAGAFGLSPFDLLRMRALGQDQNATDNVPMPPPRPAEFGAPQGPTPPVPLPAPPQDAPGSAPPQAPQAAPAAAPPAPVAGPSGGGGSSPFSAAGIGSRLADIMGGRGIFGGSASDEEVDPVTGVPRGISRGSNMQSMMKMGVMLIAAGQRQSDESRARVLSGMAGAIGDNTEQINQFAKTRLEMAKAKLAEREILMNESAERNYQQGMARYLGGGTGQPAAAPLSNAPAGTQPVVAPQTAAPLPPPLPAVGGAPTGPAPLPSPLPAVGGTASGGLPPSLPAVGGTPGGGLPEPAPAPAMTQTPATGAPGAAPGAAAGIAPTRPPAPDPSTWSYVPSDAEQTYLRSPALSATERAARVKQLAEWQRKAQDGEIETQPYHDPLNNAVMADKYVMKNGKVVLAGSRKVDSLPERSEEKLDPATSERITVTYAPNGTVTKINRGAPSPQVMEALKSTSGTERQSIEKDRERHLKSYDGLDRANSSYDRLGELAKIAQTGEMNSGTFGQIKQKIGNLLTSTGNAQPWLIDRIINTDLAGAELDLAAGEFAKTFMGPQISNMDIQNAKEAIGAARTNAGPRLAAALLRMQEEARRKIEKYNDEATSYNANVAARNLSDVVKVPTINRTFPAQQGTEVERIRRGAQFGEGGALQGGQQPPAPAAPTVPVDMSRRAQEILEQRRRQQAR